MLLEGVDIEGYLAHHHDMIILTAIEDAKCNTEDDVTEIQRRWASNEWANARRSFMDSLGHRSHQWDNSSVTESAYKMVASNYTPSISFSSPNQMNTFSSIKGTPSSKIKNLSFETPTIEKRNNPITTNKPVLSELIRKHSDIVHSLNSSVRKSNLTANSPCSDLAKSIPIPTQGTGKTIVSDGLTKHDLIAYRSLLQLLSSVVGEDRHVVIPSGSYSVTCFDSEEVYNNVLLEKRRSLSAGAIRYLQNQIWELWSHSVDEAVQSGDLTLIATKCDGTSRQQRLKTFVTYQLRVGVIPVACRKTVLVSSSTTPLWAFVYHCLRIGDLSAAVNELQECVSGGYHNGEQAVLTVVNYLLRHLQGKDSPAADLSENESKILRDCISQCQSLYNIEIADNSGKFDVYRAICLNLLSLADKDNISSACPIPGFTLEDFLWCELWFIQVGRFISKNNALNAAGLDLFIKFDYNYYCFSYREKLFYELIQEYGGADYFDEDRSNPFKYATVLFCCQRYGDAISHLWLTNKTIPAVHLTVLCLHYGLVLPFVPLNQNPYHPLAANTHHASVEPSPVSILQIFMDSNIFQFYPEIKVDYAISLDSNWLQQAAGLDSEIKEVSKLKSQSITTSVLENLLASSEQSQLDVIVGKLIDSDSMNGGHVTTAGGGLFRTGGRLDEYIEGPQIDSILSRTAYNLLTQSGNAESAIYIYQLAGRYSEVLEELCSQLSCYLMSSNTAVSHSPGQYWKSFAETFIKKYIKANSAVMYNLKQTGSQGLVDSLIILTKLYDVVSSYQSSKFDIVLDLLDSLNLFPSREEEIDAFTTIRPQLKSVYDDVIILRIESIQRIFKQLKSNRLGSPNGSFSGLLTDRDIQMKELKEQAKVLLMFTNRIRSRLARQDIVNHIAVIEASLL